MIVPTLSRLLRLASFLICLIAVAWFVTFALNQTSDASNHQTIEIKAAPGAAVLKTGGAESTTTQSAPRRAIDKVVTTLSSPFSSLTSSSTNQWEIHLIDTALVLLVYGFGLAFVARLLRLGA